MAELEQQVTDLEQQLHDCEDALDHYQNIVSLKLRYIFHRILGVYSEV